MSIPERLWRVVRGQWLLASEALSDVDARLAEAAAYQELADALRAARPAPVTGRATPPGALPQPAPPRPEGHDPLEACYALLQMDPAGGLPALEAAYEARLAELRPDRYAPGSPERAALEARRSAVEAAYEKLRDALNTTETRFERLEF